MGQFFSDEPDGLVESDGTGISDRSDGSESDVSWKSLKSLKILDA